MLWSHESTARARAKDQSTISWDKMRRDETRRDDLFRESPWLVLTP